MLAMAKSRVRLPRGVRQPFEVYVNGVRQTLGVDYSVRAGALVFERELRKDKISGWRWFLGAWGVGTYRQDDSVDVRYETSDGSPRSAKSFGTVGRVNSAGSHSLTSFHSSGIETRASGTGRIEYAEHVVRSFAFWL